MPLIGTRQDALANRRPAPGYPTYRSDFLSEEAPKGTRRGNAKLVEQEAGSTLHAHFHYVNQFQVIVGGSGRIGRHQVAPVTVQFAGAFTSYGPLQAGPDGLDYLVLRDAINPGLRLMPEEVATLDRTVKRRYFMSSPVDLNRDVTADTTAETVIHPQEPDGLAASILSLPPGGRYRAGLPDAGGGQFHVVVAGSAACGSEQYAPLCCIFSPPDEPPLDLLPGTAAQKSCFCNSQARPLAYSQGNRSDMTSSRTILVIGGGQPAATSPSNCGGCTSMVGSFCSARSRICPTSVRRSPKRSSPARCRPVPWP